MNQKEIQEVWDNCEKVVRGSTGAGADLTDKAQVVATLFQGVMIHQLASEINHVGRTIERKRM